MSAIRSTPHHFRRNVGTPHPGFSSAHLANMETKYYRQARYQQIAGNLCLRTVGMKFSGLKSKGMSRLFALVFLAFPHFTSGAESAPVCDSISQADLIACAENSYKESDSKLNDEYRNTLSLLEEDRKKSLRSVQRRWISFRNSQCDPRGDVGKYGAEAPIERLLCLTMLSKDRTKEIERISDTHNSSSYHLILNSMTRAGFSPPEIKDRLADSESDDELWTGYVTEHCEFMNRMNGEPILDCKARVNLFRSQ
ncbi:MAG: lysozyme inhibitor LprI family protein [Luteimonas sp.]